MDYKITSEDKERIKLLNEITKNKFKSISLEQLMRLQKLLEKKDYSNDKKADKSKANGRLEDWKVGRLAQKSIRPCLRGRLEGWKVGPEVHPI